MTFWVYILRCADQSYYTGHSDNLEQRIGEHQTGACGGYTAQRLLVELAWSQECASREEALAAELRIKGWSRKKKEAMMRGDWNEVNRLGRGKHQHQRNADASTSAASPPTLSTNGVNSVRPDPSDIPTVRPDPFDTPTVRPERSEAESKGQANAISKE